MYCQLLCACLGSPARRTVNRCIHIEDQRRLAGRTCRLRDLVRRAHCRWPPAIGPLPCVLRTDRCFRTALSLRVLLLRGECLVKGAACAVRNSLVSRGPCDVAKWPYRKIAQFSPNFASPSPHNHDPYSEAFAFWRWIPRGIHRCPGAGGDDLGRGTGPMPDLPGSATAPRPDPKRGRGRMASSPLNARGLGT
jgi:hypothetical protein